MAQQNDLPFPELWVKIRELKVVNSPGHLNRALNIAWLPPECPEGFETVSALPWHIWSPGKRGESNTIRTALDGNKKPLYTLPPGIEHHDTTSIFFSTELNNFLEVPYDCTAIHVSDRKEEHEKDGWNRLTFEKQSNQTRSGYRPHLWILGHGLSKNQIDGDVYITESWNNLLLPGCFSNGIHKRNAPPTCELAGKLTMIFGVVAFATVPGDQFAMIRESFRHPPGTSYYVPTWETQRPKDQGLVPKRGLVVDVAFDASRYEKTDIERWEEGFNGPILTSNQYWDFSSIQPSFPVQRGVPTQPAHRYMATSSAG